MRLRRRALLQTLAATALASACASGLPGAAAQATGGTGAVTGLVVWDFDDQTPAVAALLPPAKRAWLRRSLGEQLAAAVERLPGIALVDRVAIAELLAEQRLGSSALADADARLRLGRLLGATRMVFGSFFALGDQVQINLRLVDVATGRILHADETTAASAEAMAAAALLAPRLVRVLGGGSPGAAAYPEATWRELDAALALIEQKKYEAALAALQALLVRQPGFAPAERQIGPLLERLRRQ
jgi:TolB-like protein